MLFRAFSSQEERRRFGGSDFIEFQYCKATPGTGIREITAVSATEHRQNDSLYVWGEDIDSFFSLYGGIFNGGVYHNLKSGIVDVFGINYYNPELTDAIINRIISEKPEDYEPMLKWLEGAKHYNGFYILGE